MDVTNPTNLEITREFFSILVQTRLKGEKFMIRGEEKVYIYILASKLKSNYLSILRKD